MEEVHERTLPNTRSWWSSAGDEAGGLSVSQWKWAAGSLQGDHSAKL